jgi:hypothetical protein
MTRSSLRERLERLGPVRDIDRVRSGSAEDFLLCTGPRNDPVDAIAASMSLARRGVSLLKAKRAIEAALLDGRAYIHLPNVDDAAAVVAELRAAGVAASLRSTPKTIAGRPAEAPRTWRRDPIWR